MDTDTFVTLYYMFFSFTFSFLACVYQLNQLCFSTHYNHKFLGFQTFESGHIADIPIAIIVGFAFGTLICIVSPILFPSLFIFALFVTIKKSIEILFY